MLGLAACSSGSKVGDESLLKFKEKDQDRLGQVKDSPSPSPSKKKMKKSTTTTSPPTPAPTKMQTAGRVVAVTIGSQGFKPFNFNIYFGDSITVINEDSQPRSFTADNGAFDSKLLAPRGSWTYKPTKAGVYNVHDESRPYVVGKVTVVARS